MHRFTLFVLAAIVCLSTFAQKQYKYETVENDPMKVRIYTLDNGLKVYLSVNDEKPRITARIAVNTGSKNDPAENTGLAHYLEHLMFKGTKQFGTSNYEAERPLLEKITELYEEYIRLTDPDERKAKYHEIDSVSQLAAQYNIPNEYDKLMATIGSEGTNAHTSSDETVYKEDIPSNELENWARIQSDRFQNLVIRGFHTELEAVYEEKNISLSNDMRKAIAALFKKSFPTHSYGTQTTLGTQEHLKNPSILAIQNYFNRYYVPNNVAICMSGDLDPDKTIAIIDKYFSSWKPGADISHRQFEPQPVFTTPQDSTVLGQEQEFVFLGWTFKGEGSIQNDTLSLISSILYNGRAGLIDLDINKKMAAQEASCFNYSQKEYSTLLLDGMPKQGQKLEDVAALLLTEVEKLKKGVFDDDLLVSIINNQTLSFNKSLESNSSRVDYMIRSFINGTTWKQDVEQLKRMASITKADIVRFANQHLGNGYICIYKVQGEDPSIKKIDKPAITPIPANRDLASDFLKEITASKPEPIQPHFVNFNKDITFGQTYRKLPIIYKQNTDNELFTLVFRYEFGSTTDNRYDVAAQYLKLLGTDRMSNEQITKQFYKLACSFNINPGEDETEVTISGLNQNMPAALNLYQNIIQNAKSDKTIYNKMVNQILKDRAEMKKDQKAAFSYLRQYAKYGEYNPYTNVMSESDLKETDPQELLDLLRDMDNYKHRILYYGPSTLKQLNSALSKYHKTAKHVLADRAENPYKYQETPENEIWIAPYEAKNIYMELYNNEGRFWNPEEAAVQTMFNEYFGGGMNTIVFQELRETRGLAYSASAYYRRPSIQTDPEIATAMIISQNDKMMDCINVFKQIIDTIPQSESSFNIAKQSVEKSLATQRTSKMPLIRKYIYSQRIGVDYDLNEKIYEDLPSVTLDSIVKFENTTMAGKPYRYIILGDEKELDMQSLEKIGPIKRLTLEQVFGY